MPFTKTELVSHNKLLTETLVVLPVGHPERESVCQGVEQSDLHALSLSCETTCTYIRFAHQ